MGRFGGTQFRRLKKLRYEAYIRQGGKCYHCKKHMIYLYEESRDPMRCSAEHLIPKRSGGKITKTNIVAVHQQCNQDYDLS